MFNNFSNLKMCARKKVVNMLQATKRSNNKTFELNLLLFFVACFVFFKEKLS